MREENPKRMPGGVMTADATEWEALAEQARLYLAAGAWKSAHDLLWPHLAPHWDAQHFPAIAIECLCLLLGACTRLNHKDHLARATRWLRDAQVRGVEMSSEARALAALSCAHHEMGRKHYAAADRQLAEAASLADVSICTRARIALLQGRLAASSGDERAAERCGLRAAREAELAANEIMKADAFSLLAILARRRGSLDEASALYGKAASCYWRSGDLGGLATVQLNRAWTVGLIGLLGDSERLFEEALQHAVSLGREGTALRARLGLGWLAVRGGDLAGARRRLLGVWRAARTQGLARIEGMALEYLTAAYTLAGALPKAAAALRLGLRLATDLSPMSDLVLEFHIREAMLSMARGEKKLAMRQARAARRSARQLGMPWEEAQARMILAIAYVRSGRKRDARVEFENARVRLAAIGEQLERQVAEAWLRTMSATAPDAHTRADLPAGLRFWLEHPLLGPHGQQRSARTGVRPEPPREDPGTCHPHWSDLGFVTQTPAVLKTLRAVETYAPGYIPMLILGETGTGKDLIARGLHLLSGHPGSLVPVNCAAARKDLFVAELFGARRGAYTGALEHRQGLIEEAENGTLFFDEIADLEAEAQGYLLRFLDSGEVRPVGGTQSRQIKTRVIAATCRDLRQLVRDGRFREDLFARLAGFVVEIPPLRERPADIGPIALELWCREGGDERDGRAILGPEVMRVLKLGRWRGNVREFRHTLARAVLLCRVEGTEAARRALLGAADPGETEHRPVREHRGHWDGEDLDAALTAADGRISGAARILGISRSHAYRLYKHRG